MTGRWRLQRGKVSLIIWVISRGAPAACYYYVWSRKLVFTLLVNLDRSWRFAVLLSYFAWLSSYFYVVWLLFYLHMAFYYYFSLTMCFSCILYTCFFFFTKKFFPTYSYIYMTMFYYVLMILRMYIIYFELIFWYGIT